MHAAPSTLASPDGYALIELRFGRPTVYPDGLHARLLFVRGDKWQYPFPAVVALSVSISTCGPCSTDTR